MRKRLLTTGELARELGISPRTLARYVKLGWLEPTETSLGGHYRWDLEDVRAQMRRQRERRDDGSASAT